MQARIIHPPNLPDLERMIRRLNDGKLLRRASAKALMAASQPFLAEVMRMVPVDTGALKNSVVVKRAKNLPFSTAVALVSGGLGFTGDTWYAGPVHFGHKIGKRTSEEAAEQSRFSKKYKRNAEMKAARQSARLERSFKDDTMVPGQPYIWDAIDATHDQVDEIFEREIVRELQVAFNRKVRRSWRFRANREISRNARRVKRDVRFAKRHAKRGKRFAKRHAKRGMRFAKRHAKRGKRFAKRQVKVWKKRLR